LDADHGDRSVRQDAPDGRIGSEFFEPAHVDPFVMPRA